MRARHPFFLLLGTCVVGGAVGALLNSLALWAAAEHDLLARIGVAIRPEFTWPWLRTRLLWGGIWGVGFIPLARVERLVLAALFYSLVPSAVQLLYVFPHLLGRGAMGTDLGPWTPAVVLGANAVYGLGLAAWVRLSVAPR